MFTIDLLKGSCVPAKSQPGGVALAAIPFVVPAIIAIITTAHYIHGSTLITMNEAIITDTDRKIVRFEADLDFRKDIHQQIAGINRSLTEASGAISQYSQFTGVLQVLVENMPDSIVLKELELRRKIIQKNVPSKQDPEVLVRATFVQRTLLISVCGGPHSDSDRAVKQYIYRLRNSEELKPLVEDIRIVTSGADEFEGKNVTCYEIDCLFKLQK